MKPLDPHTIPHRAKKDPRDWKKDPLSALVLEAVDGLASLAEIADQCGIENEFVGRIISDLAKRGWVILPGDATSPAGVATDGSSRRSTDPGGETSGETSHRERDDRIEGVFDRVEKLNYYELLEVGPDADRRELRTQYFALSKRFHPDSPYLRRRVVLRQKAGVVFQKITLAYNTLGQPATRKAYDASIVDELEVMRIECQLTAAMAPIRGSSDQPQDPPSPSTPPRATVPTPLPQHSRFTPEPTSNRSSQPTTPRPSLRPEWKKERARRALSLMMRQRGSNPPNDRRLKSYLQDAQLALEQSDFSRATALLKDVLAADPGHREAQQLMAKATQGNVQMQVQHFLREGMQAQREGQLEFARDSFEKACDIDSTNLDAQHLLAQVLLALKGELERARELSERVVTQGGQRSRYFATLGEIYYSLGALDKAKIAFERAHSLEPDNKIYKKLLAKTQKGLAR